MDAAKQITKLHNRIAKHFAEWVAMPYVIENFKDDPKNVYQAFLDGGKRRSVLSTTTDELQTWHFAQYAHAVYNEGRYPLDELALAARYAHAYVKFEEAFADAGMRGMVLPYAAANSLCLNMLAGWRAESASVCDSVRRGLDTTLLGLRHNPEHAAGELFRHFWFLLHLYCDARNLPLDTSLYSYPPDMSPYVAVLADWRTTDLNKLTGFVNAMADFHLSEARFTRTDEIDEFDTPGRMLFPYEILAYLRLREWSGLTNPEQFDHPLMKHPMARMPSPVPLPQPETPLLDSVIGKFKLEFPGSFEP